MGRDAPHTSQALAPERRAAAQPRPTKDQQQPPPQVLLWVGQGFPGVATESALKPTLEDPSWC